MSTSMSTMTAAQVTVSTAAATAAATRCHLFKIEGYNRIKAMYGNGRSIDSCGFEAAGRTWRILFFPNGDPRESAGHASVFLKLDSAAAADDNILVEFTLSLLCHRGAPRSTGTVTETFSGKKGSKNVFGCSRFIARMELEKPRFLRDDCLAIRCDMAVLNHPAGVVKRPALPRDLKRLGIACDCEDDACKSYHRRGFNGFCSRSREALAKLFLVCFHL